MHIYWINQFHLWDVATQKKNPGANNFKSTYSFNFEQHSNEDDTVDLMNKNNGIKCHTSRGNRCLLISSSFYKIFFSDLINKIDSIKWHTSQKQSLCWCNTPPQVTNVNCKLLLSFITLLSMKDQAMWAQSCCYFPRLVSTTRYSTWYSKLRKRLNKHENKIVVI